MKVPPIGTVVHWQGHVLTLVGLRHHPKRDGGTALLLIWDSGERLWRSGAQGYRFGRFCWYRPAVDTATEPPRLGAQGQTN